MTDEDQQVATARARDVLRAAALGDYTPVKQMLEMAEEAEHRVAQARREARREALEEVQEFVVAHTFDTTVGRRIDDYITELLAEEPEG